MKLIKKILCLCIVVAITSCAKTEDDVKPQALTAQTSEYNESDILGKWTLFEGMIYQAKKDGSICDYSVIKVPAAREYERYILFKTGGFYENYSINKDSSYTMYSSGVYTISKSGEITLVNTTYPKDTTVQSTVFLQSNKVVWEPNLNVKENMNFKGVTLYVTKKFRQNSTNADCTYKNYVQDRLRKIN